MSIGGSGQKKIYDAGFMKYPKIYKDLKRKSILTDFGEGRWEEEYPDGSVDCWNRSGMHREFRK